MKKLLLGFAMSLLVACPLYAQIAPSIEWEKSYGGSNGDGAAFFQPTSDNGFIIAANTRSIDGDVYGNHGSTDYWIVKTDSIGNELWSKCFGGTSDDRAYCIKQIENGYIVAGYSESDDGDVLGNHGFLDYWILKLDVDGNLIWAKCFGGSDEEQPRSIDLTDDGGFIIAGQSYSFDGDVIGNHGGSDYWIIKIDSLGNLIWQKTLGGTFNDQAYSIQTIDGGFIVAGNSTSNDGNVSGNHGDCVYSCPSDYWIVNLDTIGNIIWQKCLGGTNSDNATSIQETIDGGFIVGGYSFSIDSDVSGNHGNADYWIVKLDSAGSIIWQNSLGGSELDYSNQVKETTDSGFIVVGYTCSNDGDISDWHEAYDDFENPYSDIWIAQLNANGNMVWKKCFGGFKHEGVSGIQELINGDFVFGGSTSSEGGDVTVNYGMSDIWIVKLSSELPTTVPSELCSSFAIYPNPVQNLLTINFLSSSDAATISVYDVSGRKIVLPTTISNNKAELTTTTLPNGIYMVQIINEKTLEVGKFVKQE